MKNKSKVILLLYAVAIAALVYYAYPVVKSRYFAPREEKGADIKTENKKNEVSPAPTKKNNGAAEESEEGEEKAEEEKDSAKIEEEKFLEITKQACDGKCEQYKSDTDEYEYCQEICGLAPAAKTAGDDCGNLEDLEKDYCLKDLAVSRKDFKICDQIDDSGVKKSCQSRVTEEILNGQNNQL